MLLIGNLLLVLGCFAVSHVTAMDISATCDNDMELYANGQRLSGSGDSNWQQVSTNSLPSNIMIVAIKCVDVRAIGGVLAEVSNGDVTDNTWKCTDVLYPGWNGVFYDDSQWPNAQVIQKNDGTGTWGQENGGQHVTGISENANWIWAPGSYSTPKTVYCRARVEECHLTNTGPCITSAGCGVGARVESITCTSGSSKTVPDAPCCVQPCDGQGNGVQQLPRCRDLSPYKDTL